MRTVGDIMDDLRKRIGVKDLDVWLDMSARDIQRAEQRTAYCGVHGGHRVASCRICNLLGDR